MKPEMLKRIGRGLDTVSAALGTEMFERELADFLGQMVAHDMMTVARYSIVAPPEFLAHSANYPRALVERYESLYHLFDPFAAYWRETQQPGFVSLDNLSSAQRKVGRYIRELLPEFGIVDEMGIFLPPLAGASLAFFFESVGHRIAKPQRDLLQALYPLAANLYRVHLSVLFSNPEGAPATSPSTSHPMLITDETGRTLWTTEAWTELSAAARSEIKTFAERGAEPTLQIRSLDDGHTVISEPLGHGAHGAARLLWVVEPHGQRAADIDPMAAGMHVFDSTLTPREREIVELILNGFPTSLIAERLSLSRGTVKNHRRRIYHKLDITTERELFLMFIEAALGTGTQAGS